MGKFDRSYNKCFAFEHSFISEKLYKGIWKTQHEFEDKEYKLYQKLYSCNRI